MATNVWATITPAVVNGSVMPNHWSRYWPTQAAAAERVEQRDAGDDRRQHHRQRAQRPHEPAAGERRPGPAARPAARRTAARATVAHSEHHIDSRSAVSALVGGEDRPGVAPRRLPQQPDERQGEERDRDDGQDQRRDGQALPADPAWRTATGAGRRRRRSRRAEAVLGHDLLALGAEEEVDERLVDLLVLSRSSTRGDRVLGDHVDVLGDLDPFGLVAGRGDVGDVDDPGVGLTGGDLGDDAAARSAPG